MSQPCTGGCGPGASAATTYDSNGNVASRTDFNGKVTTYAYDLTRNLETSRTEAYGTGSARTINTTWHSTFRLPTQIEEPNRTTTFTYDTNGNVLTRTVTDTSVVPNVSRTWTYTYNSLGLVLTENGPRTDVTDTTTYTYYGTSATCTATVSGATTTGCRGQLNTIADALSHVVTLNEYNYMAAGGTTSYGNISFTYNYRGRVKTATVAGVPTNYVYDALGQLIKKSSSSATTLFMYDEAGHLLGEYTSAGALIQETVWLGDIPVATLRPNAGGGVDIFYVHTDHLNTPRKVTRPSDNALRWRWDPDAFGNGSANENPQSLGTFVYNLRFPGQIYMSETGLHQNYFRDYDPQTGKYVESDPIGLLGGINTYAYVENNPISFVDPYGLAGCEKDDRDCLQEALNSYSLERSVNEIAGFGAGSALFGGGLQALNKTAVKPRGGIAGGGPSGRYTSYSRRYLGDIGRKLGRASVGAAAKAAGILGAGVQAYRLHYEALQIYLDCLEEKKQ